MKEKTPLCNTKEKELLSCLVFLGIGKILFSLLFDMTVCVVGSTHIVLLAKNVILGKECEENNSPTHRK